MTENTTKPAAKGKAGTDDILKSIRAAAKGLTYESESSAPLKPFLWPASQVDGAPATGPLTADALRAHEKPSADAKVAESEDVDGFFSPLTTDQDWFGDEEKQAAERARALVALLKERLTDLRVFRVGEVEIAAYVVGRTPAGDFAGVQTRLTET